MQHDQEATCQPGNSEPHRLVLTIKLASDSSGVRKHLQKGQIRGAMPTKWPCRVLGHRAEGRIEGPHLQDGQAPEHHAQVPGAEGPLFHPLPGQVQQWLQLLGGRVPATRTHTGDKCCQLPPNRAPEVPRSPGHAFLVMPAGLEASGPVLDQ